MILEQDLASKVEQLEGLVAQYRKDIQELRTQSLYMQEKLQKNTKDWTKLHTKYCSLRQKIANALAVD